MLLNLHYYVVPRFAQVSYFYMQMTLSSTPRFDFPCENFLARVKKVLYTRDGLAYGGWILVYGIRAYSRLKARVKIGATWVGPSRCYRGGGGMQLLWPFSPGLRLSSFYLQYHGAVFPHQPSFYMTVQNHVIIFSFLYYDKLPLTRLFP
jgi:hypothetical protein